MCLNMPFLQQMAPVAVLTGGLLAGEVALAGALKSVGFQVQVFNAPEVAKALTGTWWSYQGSLSRKISRTVI